MATASPPKHHHHPSMALQLWGPLIVGFWRSQCLLEETRSCSPKTVCHQALHYFSPCTTDRCLSWQYHRLIPTPEKLPKERLWPWGRLLQMALDQIQETFGLHSLLEKVCCHLPKDTPRPE